MTAARFLKLFSAGIVVFLIVDAVWLGFVAKKFYDRELGAFSRTVRLLPAVLVYILLVAGNILLVEPRASGSPLTGLLFGALYGLCTYGTYDLTNFALFKDWSLIMTVADMAWGMVVQGIVGYVVTLLGSRF
jgi:uncharacterized membrane protein